MSSEKNKPVEILNTIIILQYNTAQVILLKDNDIT